MEIVQQLVDLIEDWRFCKRLEYRHRSEEHKERSRTLQSRQVNYHAKKQSMLGPNVNLHILVGYLREVLYQDQTRVKLDDPFGTSQIHNLEYFNPQIVPRFA